MAPPLALVPVAASAPGVPWMDIGRMFLFLALAGLIHVAVVLVSPTRRCPECKGKPRKAGLCPRCDGYRRVPRFAARPIHRAFQFALKRLAERHAERLAEARERRLGDRPEAP